MSRREVIDDLINVIYSSNLPPTYSQAEVDIINIFYKENFSNCSTLSDFEKIDKTIEELILREPTVRAEIESKIAINKGLQSGIINECNLSSSLAKILNLNNRVLLRNASDVPCDIVKIAEYMEINLDKCRYIYCNNELDTLLFQFGDPLSCDAILLYKNETINIEYKERMAKAGEYDLIHDVDGKLYIPQKFKQIRPELIRSIQPMVDEFNVKTTLWKSLGSNFKNFSNATRIMAICGYFVSKEIDVLMSTDVNDEVIAIIPEWIDLSYDEDDGGGFSVISAKGSEIRTTGRNPHNILCMDHFKKIFTENGGRIDGGKCQINEGNKIIKIAKSRGIGHPSKLKINNMYEVPLKNRGYGHAYKDGDKWIFDVKSVRQKLPTVSPHITLVASRKEIINNILKDIKYIKTSNTQSMIERKANVLVATNNKKPKAISNSGDRGMVENPYFGKGYVVGVNKEKNRITVRFKSGEKNFIYPDAFSQGYLKKIDK